MVIINLIPWGTLLTAILQMAGWAIARSAASAQIKKDFYDLIEKMNSEKLTSAKVNSSWGEIKNNLESRKDLV